MPRKRILVIDDDIGVLEMISTMLESSGYAVDTAQTSQTALRKAQEGEYALVILDLILPDADGVILHSRLKKLSPGIEGRTIFMTGFTSKEPVIEYLKSISAEFIHKPFSQNELLSAVARLI